MDIVGIDIAKAKFDAALLAGKRTRHAASSNMGETRFHPTRLASSSSWPG